MKKLIASLLILFFFLNLSWGQESDYLTVVKLKDGSVFEGQLKEYQDGDYIIMDIGLNQITIDYESIKSIKHKSLKFDSPYSFREKGWFHHSNVALLPGYVSSGNPVIGLSIDHTSGFLFKRLLGAGLNVGINNYNPTSREVFYTIGAELRGYLLAKNFSPYYVLRTGYGFLHKGDTFTESNGGFFANPGIGFRFGGKKVANFTTELGLCFQNAFLKENTNDWQRSIIEKDVRYQRFTIKIGILF